MLIPGMESMVCVVTLLLGSVGMFVLFLYTDNDARAWSEVQKQRSEKRDKK